MNNCEAFELLASAVIDDEATRAEREALYRHLATCERCDAFLTEALALQVAAARKGLNRLPAPGDATYADPLPRQVQNRRRSFIRHIWKKTLPVPVPVLGSIVIIAVLLIYALSGAKPDPPAEPEFQATRVNQTAVTFPVVRIP
jgi:anti-sigma factor RsiW